MRHTYIVTGRGVFPFDMLRRDESWPKTTDDAVMIGQTEKRTVTLVTDYSVNVQRWESFGWTAAIKKSDAQALHAECLPGWHKVLLFPLFASFASSAVLAEQARVLSSEPYYEPISVPVQSCTFIQPLTQPQQAQSSNLGPTVAGAVVGGIIGRATGNSTGGRDRGTVAGAVVGGVIGNQLGKEQAPTQVAPAPTQQCATVITNTMRLVGYAVTYEYAGRRYHALLNYSPSAFIDITVQPTRGVINVYQ